MRTVAREVKPEADAVAEATQEAEHARALAHARHAAPVARMAAAEMAQVHATLAVARELRALRIVLAGLAER